VDFFGATFVLVRPSAHACDPVSLLGKKYRCKETKPAPVNLAAPPPRPHRAPPCARARPRPPQACISGCDTKAAANGRVEEAMDPSPALNQPPLAVSPPDMVNRRAGTRSLAVRHRGRARTAASAAATPHPDRAPPPSRRSSSRAPS